LEWFEKLEGLEMFERVGRVKKVKRVIFYSKILTIIRGTLVTSGTEGLKDH
jgi:hypothetical protein